MAFKHTACFVFTVMIVCNAVLYPSIFSTMFRQWFGASSTKPEEKREPEPDMPPHMRQRGPGPAHASRRSELNPRRTTAGEPGGAFFAGKGGGGDSGRGRGLMGSILPVYAVGILLYFAYIMYKIFLKDKKPEDNSSKASANFTEFQSQYGPTLERQKAEELQRSLAAELKGTKKVVDSKLKATKAAAKDGDDNEVDVKALQKRLEDTEQAMQRMMDMMSNMGVAMNQVTKQLCTERNGGDEDGEEDDDLEPDLQADDEISDIDDPLAGHSSEEDEDDNIDNDPIREILKTTSKPDYVSMKDTTGGDNNEVEVVEDIGMEEDEKVEEDGGDSTVRRRHVGSTEESLEDSVQ